MIWLLIKTNVTLSFAFPSTHLWWSPRSLQLSVNIMVTCTSDAWSEQFNQTQNLIRKIEQNESNKVEKLRMEFSGLSDPM